MDILIGLIIVGAIIAIIVVAARSAVIAPVAPPIHGPPVERPKANPKRGAETFTCKLAGASYLNDDRTSRQAALRKAKTGDAVELVPEPGNLEHARAIKVVSMHGQIGYLRREVAERLSKRLEVGARLFGNIVKLYTDEKSGKLTADLKVHVAAPQSG